MVIGTFSDIERVNNLVFDDIILYEDGHFLRDDFRHHKDKVTNLGYFHMSPTTIFEDCIANVLYEKSIDSRVIKEITDEFKNDFYPADTNVKKLVARIKLLGLNNNKQVTDICSKINEVGLNCFYLYGDYNGKMVIDRTQYPMYHTIFICGRHASNKGLLSASVNNAFKTANEDGVDDLSMLYRYPVIKSREWRFNSLECSYFSDYIKDVIRLSSSFGRKEELRIYCNKNIVCGYSMPLEKDVRSNISLLKYTKVKRYTIDLRGIKKMTVLSMSEAKNDISDSKYDYGMSITDGRNIKWLEA